MPGYRSQRTRDDVRAHGLMYGTLRYRSIEVLLGDVSFGAPMDSWAAGCIFGEMLLLSPVFRDSSAIGMIASALRLLGSPAKGALAYFRSLPHWSEQFPMFFEGELESKFGKVAPPVALQLLKGLLELWPEGRLTAAGALRHQWWLPEEAPPPPPEGEQGDLPSGPLPAAPVAVDQATATEPSFDMLLVQQNGTSMFQG